MFTINTTIHIIILEDWYQLLHNYMYEEVDNTLYHLGCNGQYHQSRSPPTKR